MYLHIFLNGDHPVIDLNTNPSYRPDAEIWAEDKHKKVICYLIQGDYINYGAYTSPYCFLVYKMQNIEETYQKYLNDKNNKMARMFTEQDLENIQARQWIYMDQIDAERFQEDSEVINEGLLIITKYFDNNSLKEKEIIDLETGECLYYMRYTMNQYWSEKHQRTMSAVSDYEKMNGGKYMKLSTTYQQKIKQYRWVFQYPLAYKGLEFASIYGKNTTKSIKRNATFNTRK